MQTQRLNVSVVALFALTIFTSAYLLFQVQPLISKFILPWFGGSPAVWTTAMLFFQCVLFGGYVYAHALSRHGSARVQSTTHLILLVCAALLAAFVIPDAALKPSGDEWPTARILLILGASVGLPYFCLATTGPLIQYWFTRTSSSASVFRLYALSNLGSFLALLSFPYVFEPIFDLPQLGQLWTGGFWVFALLCAAVTLYVRRFADASPADAVPGTEDSLSDAGRPATLQRFLWVALPALASLAFIATTDYVSHHIAPEPRLWIATLGLYLVTFIITFDHPRWYQRKWVATACLAAVAFLSGRDEVLEFFGVEWDYSVTAVRWINLSAMFLVCFMSHGELYRRRPKHPRYLTEFYLLMSFGGACGGLFVALVATNLFPDYYEWPLYLVATIVLGASVLAAEAKARRAGPGIAWLAGAGLCALVLFWEDPLHWRPEDVSEGYSKIRLYQSRNFYGTISVDELRFAQDPAQSFRVFFSGRVTHGLQYLDPAKRRLPVSYYGEESGVGETLNYAKSRHGSLDVAIIGLGAATLATYARAEDRYDFYEINPTAVAVADEWFDNLSTCLAQSKRIIVGDARLKMEELPDSVRYDVIVLDAFTGGSVPIHLLTREAFQTYERHLKPGGFIAAHITNGYLNLYPVVRGQAEALKIGFRNKYQSDDPDRHIRRNQWFVMTNDREYLARHPSVNRRYLDADGKLLREEDPSLPNVRLWTDHFSSLNAIELSD